MNLEFLEILKGSDALVVCNYRYRLREKFLNRYPRTCASSGGASSCKRRKIQRKLSAPNAT